MCDQLIFKSCRYTYIHTYIFVLMIPFKCIKILSMFHISDVDNTLSIGLLCMLMRINVVYGLCIVTDDVPQQLARAR